ncbi:Formin-like protein 6 [Mycena sanguinolenta]|uniref:Formin-like protein 6 n=1 Tax=Mycena sanguinolenta TaxID=230812 RepID=A0A8H6YAL7_9AGAR|nr:Formin-like protein 6 [Mycena sanguinolenta]
MTWRPSSRWTQLPEHRRRCAGVPANGLPPVSLLPATKARGIGVFLPTIKMSSPDIKKAVLEMDDERLTVDALMRIQENVPTAEEMRLFKDFDDLTMYSKEDQYVREIMTIPRLAERMKCMVFRRKFEMDIMEYRPQLNFIHLACKELRHATRFQHVLQAVLHIGNSLNSSTFRGGARGFKLDTLSKLKELKSANTECPTLLHYLARVLMQTDPSLVNFVEDLPTMEPAARLILQTVLQNVKTLVAGLGDVTGEVEFLKSRVVPANDQFIPVMEVCLTLHVGIPAHVAMRSHSFSELARLLTPWKRCVMLWDQNLTLFCCITARTQIRVKSPAPEKLFGEILSFSSSLQKCALALHDLEEKRNPKKPIISEPSEEEATSESTIKIPDSSSQPLAPPRSQGRSVGRGDLDQAIRSMREGKRRARPSRPLSKMFLDGGRPQSRMYE